MKMRRSHVPLIAQPAWRGVGTAAGAGRFALRSCDAHTSSSTHCGGPDDVAERVDKADRAEDGDYQREPRLRALLSLCGGGYLGTVGTTEVAVTQRGHHECGHATGGASDGGDDLFRVRVRARIRFGVRVTVTARGQGQVRVRVRGQGKSKGKS